MADRTIKPDDTNDLVLQNNHGGAKIEINEGDDVQVTIGSASGDDLNVDSGKFVVKGDTGNVGIGTESPDTATGFDSPCFEVAGSDPSIVLSKTGSDSIAVVNHSSYLKFINDTEDRAFFQLHQDAPANSFIMNSSGNIIHNGLTTYTNAFAQALSTTTNFDVTVPDSAQMFILNAWHGYYPGADYYANIFAVYAYRTSDTALGQLKDYFTHSHSNSGSFSVSITSGTNIRVTKTGGAAGSYARGCIQLIFNES